MRFVAIVLAATLAIPAAAAQGEKPQKPARKPAAQRPVHAKPTPQQIRRFNELEKKEQAAKKAKSR